MGARGEQAAAKYLKRAGMRILGRNVHLGRYEVDIIAQEGDTIALVEVKTRATDAFATPDVNITHTKRQHLISAARQYADERDDPDISYRFDVVTVVWPETGTPAITHYRDAFPAR
ncbi:MAG: YraN family protein [bacterium]|nr:YraN family protein [bacterium]